MITYDINVLIGKDDPNKDIYVKRHDTGINFRVFLKTSRRISAWRYEESDYMIPENSTAVMTISKPDGTFVLVDGAVSVSDVFVKIPDDSTAFAVSGIASAEVTIYDENSRRITSATFNIEVLEECACDCEEDSGNYIDLLGDTIKEIREAAGAASAAETSANEAAIAASSAEKSASDAAGKAETAEKTASDHTTAAAASAARAETAEKAAGTHAEAAKAAAERSETAMRDLPNKVTIIPNTTGKYRVYVQTSGNKTETYGMDRGLSKNTVPIRNDGGTINVGTPTEKDHAVPLGYFDKQLEPLSERIATLEEKHRGFVTVEGANEKIDIPSGARQYAQIIEIYGAQATYNSWYEYYTTVRNYPQRIVASSGAVLFEMPSDVASRLAEFGIVENCIFFEDGKAYYRQACRTAPYSFYGPDEYLEEGEKCIDTIYDETFIIRMKEPIVTDISDYITFDGAINIDGSDYILIEMAFSKEAVEGMIADDVIYGDYTWSVGKTKIVFEV